MAFNIDSVIFICFLTANLILGLMASRGVNTIRSFAVGDKNFSTATLVFTIVSIWVSGEFFFTIVAESYKDGLIFMSILIADFLSYFLIGLVCAHRMSEFLGKISIAEAMGDLYGNKVRTITSICGVVGVIGVIAIQLQIAGLLFEYVLNIEHYYGIIISGIIITLYSSFGGIKSVTFTDIVQFGTFGVIIPVIATVLWHNTDQSEQVWSSISENVKFSFSNSFSFSNPQIYYYVSLFLWLLIPNFDPAIFQRVAMARDTKQVQDSFIIASIAGLALAALVCWIGVLILFNYPNIPEDDILKYTVSDYAGVGFKGLIAAGVMAMIMSTVDSYVNSNSILLVHDLNKSLNVRLGQNELYYTRICSMIIGFISIILALRGGNFFELILWTSTCYMPIVTVPFIMSIFGFRSSSKSVLAGMAAGFVVVIFWELFLKEQMAGVGGLIPGMLANLAMLFAYHYANKQPGGWIGIKNPRPLIEAQEQKKRLMNEFLSNISCTNFLGALRKNIPSNHVLTTLFGIFIMVSTFFSINSVPKDAQENYSNLFNFLYPVTLSAATMMTAYPLYAARWGKNNIVAIAWHLVIFIVLVCFSFLIVLLSDFAEMQLMVFMVNILAISSLISWRFSLFYLLFGLSITTFLYENLIVTGELVGFDSIKLKIFYLSMLLASVLVMFIKPRQKHQEVLENNEKKYQSEISSLNEAVDHYSERVADQAKEIERLGATAQKILNNVNHELRLPVGNVMNFAEMLYEGLGNYSQEQLKELTDEVYQNSTRLSTMILNMLDLATLDVKKVGLVKSTENFSELVRDRVKICRNIYLQGKPIDFKLIIEPEILISIDPNYMRQVVDNLVINAINFSEKGTVEIEVRRNDDAVVMTLRDRGKGIPREELFDIFKPFKMGSNSECQSQGRGVGLALCKSAVEAHGGSILAESPGGIGALFTIILMR